jgi:hypothetical protein
VCKWIEEAAKDDVALRHLVLKETVHERELRQTAEKVEDPTEREKQVRQVQDAYWYMRLINASYLQEMHELIRAGNYI